MPYGTVNADLMTTSDGVSSSGLYGFKNRIINGAMVIDQRNAGASVTIASGNTYTLDRWVFNASASSKISTQQSSTAPVGFSNSMLVTSLSAYSVGASDYFIIRQKVEGFNTADLAWGTVNAKTVTLSFQVYSSLTGTFGGSIFNSAENRFYPFTYTISSANTWEQKSVTVAGDQSGTWIGGTNGIGIQIGFGLGAGSSFSTTAGAWTSTAGYTATGATSVVGTNGATFYITGVQLEKGSTATSFDYRPYGTELALCQRYYQKFLNSGSTYTSLGNGRTTSSSGIGRWNLQLFVPMRASPTLGFINCVGYDGTVGGAISVSTAYTSTTSLDADLNTSGMAGTASTRATVLMLSNGYLELTGAEL